jgi:hypothetical protein
MSTFVLFTSPTGIDLTALSGTMLTSPSSAYNLFDHMPGPPGTADPLPLHRARNRGAMYDGRDRA